MIFLFLVVSEVEATKPTISVLGVIPAQMPNQYLVVLEICAGSEKLDAPKLYVSSDSSDTGTLELRAILAPNSCRYEDITIRAKDPASITVNFESPVSSDERIEKLERELAELKKQLKENNESKNVTKSPEPPKAKEDASKKSEKPDPLKSILLTPSDIKDEKSWKVELAYDGAYYLNLPNGIAYDTGVKRAIIQHYTRHDKLISASSPWTITSLIQVFANEKSKQLSDAFEDLKTSSQFRFEPTKIGDADCLVDTLVKDMSLYVCKINKYLIFVDGLKITSTGSEKDIGGQIMESLVTKTQVTTQDSKSKLPDWIKQVTGFWVKDQIDDAEFVQVIEYLIQQKIITIPHAETAKGEAGVEIPKWIKTNAKFWVDGVISDNEFATGLEWLINNGRIRV